MRRENIKQPEELAIHETKGEPDYPWADNSSKNQTTVSCKEHKYCATFIIWESSNQG